MKLTKHAQSCFLIETEGKRILIDPGKFVYHPDVEGMKPEEWRGIDIILLTHKHHDHTEPNALKIIKQNNPKSKIYCNEEVFDILGAEGLECSKIKIGDVIKEGQIGVQAVKAVHGYNVDMKDTGLPKMNNGYLIKAEGKQVYHTSDTLGFWTEIRPDILLIPICGNGVVFEPEMAVEFAEMIEAKLVIPMHYDGLQHPRGTEKFEEEIKKTDLKYKILEIGETIEV